MCVIDVVGFVFDIVEIIFVNVLFILCFIMLESGVEVEIEFGYLGKFKYMGVYIVDEVEESLLFCVIIVICWVKV